MIEVPQLPACVPQKEPPGSGIERCTEVQEEDKDRGHEQCPVLMEEDVPERRQELQFAGEPSHDQEDNEGRQERGIRHHGDFSSNA
jgi:hypothetical protein